MSLPTTNAIFAQVRAVAQTYIEYPFIELGDSDTKIYHMICTVNRDDYDATAVELDDVMSNAASAGVIQLPFAADSGAYFVGDFGHSPKDGGLVEFERIFANIPADRDGEFTGTQSFTYPGMNTNGDKSGTDDNVTATSFSDPITTLTVTNTVSVGDVIYLVLAWTGTVSVNFNGFRTVLSGSTGSVIKVSGVSAGTTFDSGTVTELNNQPRGQKPELTGSITDFTYYLPGVTGGITVPEDVTETDTFNPFDPNTAQATVTLSVTTIPTFGEYQAQIDAGNYIVIDSRITRWKGNIIQKANLKIRAL